MKVAPVNKAAKWDGHGGQANTNSDSPWSLLRTAPNSNSLRIRRNLAFWLSGECKPEKGSLSRLLPPDATLCLALTNFGKLKAAWVGRERGGVKVGRLFSIIRGNGHVTVWFWLLCVTVDYWQSPYRPKGARLVSVAWNPD